MSAESFAPSLQAVVVRPAKPLALHGLEIVSAALLILIIVLLFGGVITRYVFSLPVIWIDEVLSIAFLWLCMLGSAVASNRSEHLRLDLFVERLPVRARAYVEATAAFAVVAFLLGLLPYAYEYAREEWFITSASLEIPSAFRAAALPFGLALMLAVTAAQALRRFPSGRVRLAAFATVATVIALAWLSQGWLAPQSGASMLIYLLGFAISALFAGVPIAFCFGIGVLAFLAFGSQVPPMILVGRMDEGMSSRILISVPIFVLLGCVLDATGMGRAIINFLASLIGHVKAGMSYVLLGSLFLVSGISGSKVSDMATVAPALFPEMQRRGHKTSEMTALLATGAAMADTVPPSIVLIVLGSVVGVSIAGLFQSGFVVAMVLLLVLLVLARWKARHENTDLAQRPPLSVAARLMLVALPALVLPFVIRSLVGGGVATATEVSTIAVLYALVVGHLMYGGIPLRKLYTMCVDTAAMTGAILIILGTAAGMAWAITQSGIIQQLSSLLTQLPGGAVSFMVVTVVIFLVMGCILEGLPAVLLLAPIMFPIARQFGINEIHYSMVVVCAMNLGLMMPPIGVGFYLACRIGGGKPDEVIKAIWPYLAALLVGVAIIAAVPAISTIAL
jgi:tripartite ATP-independent transporter DctM subunit